MDYKMLKDDNIEKEVEISVPNSELEKLIDIETEKLRTEIKIAGYRKGRAPIALIRNKYKDSLKAQAMDGLIQNSYLTLLKEKAWKPASQAELMHVEEGDPIKIRMHIEVIPEFEVKNYLNIEVFKEPPLPDEFLLEQGMNALREQHAEIREIKRPAVVDDYVTIDIEVQNGKTTKKETNQRIKIGDRSLPDEINRALVGAKGQETKDVKADDKTYRLSIKKIEEKNLPQIDEDFARTMKFSSVEELTKKLLENVKFQEEKRLEDNVRESISRILLERIHFTVPNSLIQNEYEKILREYSMPDSDSNKERFWNVAENRIRFNLIMNRIAEKESLQVTEEEIVEFVRQAGMKLSEQNRNEVIEYLGGILSREKVMDFLLKNAKISEKSRILTPKEAANDTHSLRH